jgi:hypothetical protein
MLASRATGGRCALRKQQCGSVQRVSSRRPLSAPVRAIELDFSDPDTQLSVAGCVLGLVLGLGAPAFYISRTERDEERLEELRALNRATFQETGEYMSEVRQRRLKAASQRPTPAGGANEWLGGVALRAPRVAHACDARGPAPLAWAAPARAWPQASHGLLPVPCPPPCCAAAGGDCKHQVGCCSSAPARGTIGRAVSLGRGGHPGGKTAPRSLAVPVTERGAGGSPLGRRGCSMLSCGTAAAAAGPPALATRPRWGSSARTPSTPQPAHHQRLRPWLRPLPLQEAQVDGPQGVGG